MAEQCALRVLANGSAELQAEREVREFDALSVEVLDRKAPDQHEPPPVFELAGTVREERAEPGRVEVGPHYGVDGDSAGPHSSDHVDDRPTRVIVEDDGPGLRSTDIGSPPDGARRDRLSLRPMQLLSHGASQTK